jgi:hypothetical protein
MLLSTAVALAAVPLYLAAGRAFGAPGLAAAGSLAMTANALATLVWARRLHGGPSLAALAATTARALAIAALAAAAAHAARPGLPGRGGALLDLALGGGAFAAVSALGVWRLGDPVMREAARGVLRRLQRRRPVR